MAEGSWIRIGAIDARLDATTVNDIIKTAVGERMKSITQMPELRQQIGEALLEQVTPFVPYKQRKDQAPGDTKGHLRASGRATDDGRLYWTAINSRGDNYASYVYDEEKNRWDGNYAKPSTDYTYPQWVNRVVKDPEQWETFINKITPLIKEAFAKYD
jgi:hypothetical protein